MSNKDVATTAISVLVAFIMGCGIETQTEDGKGLVPEVLKDYILDSEMEEIQEALNPKPKKSKDVPTTGIGYNPLATINMQAPFPITPECVQARKESIEAALLWL